MKIATITSQELDQDPYRATMAAKNGPVFITEGGIPTHVLLTIEEYETVAGKQPFVGDIDDAGDAG